MRFCMQALVQQRGPPRAPRQFGKAAGVARARGKLAHFLSLEGYGHRESRAMAARLMQQAGSFARLRTLSAAALRDALGIGAEGAARVRAALELAESVRAVRARAMSVSTPESVFRWARHRLVPLPHEELWLLAADGNCRLKSARCVARGGISHMLVTVRDVLRIALTEAAHCFVLVHNHPSGDPRPSPQDAYLTSKVFSGAVTIDVPILDHVVVATQGYASVDFAFGTPTSVTSS